MMINDVTCVDSGKLPKSADALCTSPEGLLPADFRILKYVSPTGDSG